MGGLRIGLLACDILKREFEHIIGDDPDFVEKQYLEFALHADPENMKKVIMEEAEKMLRRVDVLLLGYAVCNSLEGIDKRFSKPVIMLPGYDCIDALLGSEEYAREKKICGGTWFSSPGWAAEGTNGMIKELHLDSVEGVPPEFFLDMLFASYERVLHIDPGIGNSEEYQAQSEQVAKELKLRCDCRTCNLNQLEATVKRAKETAAGL